MARATVRVSGLRELNRALDGYADGAQKDMRKDLQKAIEPVRRDAEQLAVSSIRNIGPTWARMRAGATSRVAYVAPATRNRGGSPRSNLGRLLFEEAMQPALEQNEAEIEEAVEDLLDAIGRRFGF
jgi:hypothetical protein